MYLYLLALLATSFSAILTSCSDSSTPIEAAAASSPEEAKTVESLEETPSDFTKHPGHSLQGQAFTDGPRTAIDLIPGVREHINFPITTKSPEAQAWFNQGVGQLHGFWNFEAERSFRMVLKYDPDCAMAYWGLAMSHTVFGAGNTKRAYQFTRRAAALKSTVSRREQLWIESMEALYPPQGSPEANGSVNLAHAHVLQKLVAEFPDDIEAKAFLSLHVWHSGIMEKLPATREQISGWLDEVFKVQPLHPAHHYKVHLWDNRDSSQALTSAALMGPSAPSIAHLWHMSAHTYEDDFRYLESTWHLEASARVDHAHMAKFKVLPYQIHNYFHNNNWLNRNLVKIGNAEKALALAKNLIELPQAPHGSDVYGQYNLTTTKSLLVEILWDFELWDEVLRLENTPYLAPSPDDENLKTKQDFLVTVAQKMKAPDFQPSEVLKFIERSENRNHAPKSFQAILALQAGDLAKAERLARSAYKLSLYEAMPLANLTYVLHKVGKSEQAKTYFDELRESSEALTIEAPPFQRLVEVAKDLKLADLPANGDYRLAWKAPEDTTSLMKVRGGLESLGPMQWKPTAANDFKVEGLDGNTYGLENYKGKPVLLVMFLTYQCLGCVKQLVDLDAKLDDFKKAGIEVLAVSSQDAEFTAKLNELRKEEGQPNFKINLASDPKHKIFHDYMAFDDFTNVPMHGVFFIDAKGRIRWQHTGGTAFSDIDFLLEESKRLMQID